ncbi:hypothetical protein RFI_20205 [Reticulomyxa filosa]|uniref:RING-type domain-containing protein n=1 Tax=Reticulomyxa filosa TaxID=46433 RepID=X6MVJ7_RETFI|nr:hypothetical protein RFI_20205 [Reticulomyxa filosa]|eukprot:ETO17130.1 hypothetical protein RFI_20205 [Reticulomyxa filosa]
MKTLSATEKALNRMLLIKGCLTTEELEYEQRQLSKLFGKPTEKEENVTDILGDHLMSTASFVNAQIVSHRDAISGKTYYGYSFNTLKSESNDFQHVNGFSDEEINFCRQKPLDKQMLTALIKKLTAKRLIQICKNINDVAQLACIQKQSIDLLNRSPQKRRMSNRFSLSQNYSQTVWIIFIYFSSKKKIIIISSLLFSDKQQWFKYYKKEIKEIESLNIDQSDSCIFLIGPRAHLEFQYLLDSMSCHEINECSICNSAVEAFGHICLHSRCSKILHVDCAEEYMHNLEYKNIVCPSCRQSWGSNKKHLQSMSRFIATPRDALGFIDQVLDEMSTAQEQNKTNSDNEH